jgi:hypothetical protein
MLEHSAVKRTLEKMKALGLCILALTLVAGSSAATPAERAAKLEALKKEFPAHSAGPINEKTDPAIGEIFFKYKKMVSEIELQDLEADFERLRSNAEMELRDLEQWNKLEQDTAMNAGKRVRLQNVEWIKTKLQPYIKKLGVFVFSN